MAIFTIIIFVLIGLFVQFIFIIDSDILFDKAKIRRLFLIALILFAVRFVLKFFEIHTRGIELLTMPFMTLVIFWIMATVYYAIFEDYPERYADGFKDPSWVFNFLFWIVGTIAPVFLAYEIF